MADEEVMGSVSPAPSDHKRKLDDLDSEPCEQPPVSADSNGKSQSVADADGDAAQAGNSSEDPDVKRPRLDDKPGGSEAAANGHQEEIAEIAKEEDNTETEPLAEVKNTESEEDEEKSNEPLDAIKNESVIDEPREIAIENQESTENLEEESTKEENQESEVEHQDPAPQGEVTDYKEELLSSDQPTSRRMEVPSNKVGVLIGKGGDTIRTLQYSSGARIQITRDSEADPNSATRSVELIGSIDDINKAERLIKDVIAEADAGGSPSLVARGFSVHSSGSGEQVHIQVPNEKVGVIIGKGGETIKNLQTRSGARIQLIPQHLPEGDQSKERTVRVTGDRKQIEAAKEMIKEVMEQPIRSSTPSGGNNRNNNNNDQQNYRGRGGSGPNNHWGPNNRGHHSSQQSGYNNYPQRGPPPYPSQNPPPYSSSQQGYGNYPPPKNNYNWDQRPPPEQTGYDYYNHHQGGSGGHMSAPPPQQPPMHHQPAMGPPPVNYNYGPPQGGGPDYGPPPPQYSQPAPQGYSGHSQGYGEPRFDHAAPTQHPPPTYPQGTTAHSGYGQQAYNAPQQQAPPYGQSYGPPRQQPVPTPQQGYSQYGAPAPVSNDGGYGYPSQGGQPVSGYGQTGGGPGYGQTAPTGGYGQQTGYADQVAPSTGGYGYNQGGVDPGYNSGYGAPPPVQPVAYSQPAPAPVPVPVQSGYDQTVPQTGGYVAPQPQVQPQSGYGYDNSQMYAGHR